MQPLPDILNTFTYVDSVGIWFPFKMPKELFEELKKKCGSIKPDKPKQNPDPRRVRRYTFHQPKSEAFDILERALAGQYIINRVDVSVDFIVGRYADLDSLKNFFLFHLVRPWPGKHWPEYNGTMHFWSEEGWVRNNIALYSDKACRISGDPHCLHLERRVCTASAVRAKSLQTLRAVRDLDTLEFMRSQLALRDVRDDLVFRAVVRKVEQWRMMGDRPLDRNAKPVIDEARRVLSTWLRAHQGDAYNDRKKTDECTDAALPFCAAESVRRLPLRLNPSALPPISIDLVLPP